ncbi:MAG: DUF3151 domain-containing protein [Acidimicrobiales bacterium]
MSDIRLSGTGPPETILPAEDPAIVSAIEAALRLPDDEQRAALADIVASAPRSLLGWAHLGELGRDDIEQYAAFRVGYHRGLDTLRQNGWRGSGFVRWEHPTNRGFLRALAGLARVAGRIGEHDEFERCEIFLRQLDPTWSDSFLG